jgi:PhoH-like ATPase
VLRAKSFGLTTEFVEQKGDDFQDTFFEAYSKSFKPVNGSYGILHTEKSDRLAHYWNGNYRFVKEHILRLGKKIVAPQDARQTCFIHSIFDKDIKFVASTGVPGSGKTYLALAAALQLVQRGEYDRIILSVPSEHIGGKDRYGYAPGDLDDKMFNFSRGILDNLTQLVPEMTFSDLKSVKSNFDFVDVQPLYLVRGRNLDRAIVILDEAQNIDLYTMRVLATRITDQSKLVVCGDIYQSDVQYRCQIGLKQSIEKFRNIDYPKPVFAHINLNHSQRGEFSELAWRLLQ